MKVLIIEDEQLAAEKLQRYIHQLDKSVEIIEVIQSVKNAVKWLNVNSADLIFIDIHLSDGLSFKIFEQVQVDTPVIFTTAYDQYALKAFKVNSIDYLLKPINKTDLKQALDKFKQLNQNVSKPDYSKLIQALEEKKDYQKRFLISSGKVIITVKTEDVAYFFADGKYVFLIANDGAQHILDYSLDQLEKTLDPNEFFRANRKFIVGAESIGQIITLSKSKLKVKLQPQNNIELIVSSERSRKFKEWLNQ
ncbi:MAG: LytTR family DNA-binding domain-containing protein [Bacteroidales bacterium]|nr:LytTR family DNA-binding domain-containing protein [Bacteroidales bacterium]